MPKIALQVQEKVFESVEVLVKEGKPVTAERVAKRSRMDTRRARRHLTTLVAKGRLTRRFDYVATLLRGKRQPVGRYVYMLATESRS
jgi:predicted ArsR family transcriptional regulator